MKMEGRKMKEKIKKALECLVDNGIERDEAGGVLQALGYILCDEEWEDIIFMVESEGLDD